MIKAKFIFSKIASYIKGKKIVDIGTGTGSIAYVLLKRGYTIKTIDVKNISMYEDITPEIYDGTTIPFENKKFDTAIIINVLHHCVDPIKVLKEAIRISRRIIFIEDTYRNDFEKFFISLSDMIGNFDFFSHPYKKVQEWENIIKSLKCAVIHREEWSEFPAKSCSGYGRYVLFVIEPLK